MNGPSLCTGFSSEIGTKLRDWAVGQAGAGCHSQAELSSNDSKTLLVCEQQQLNHVLSVLILV